MAGNSSDIGGFALSSTHADYVQHDQEQLL